MDTEVRGLAMCALNEPVMAIRIIAVDGCHDLMLATAALRDP
jgi:hypothetical protein